MGTRKFNNKVLVCDFETTVYEGQEDTQVWASACVEIGSEDVKIFHSIDETYDYFISLDSNLICYYHNLKFDGSFWLDFLLVRLQYKQAYTQLGDDVNSIEWMKEKDMPNKSIRYSISDRGQWYTITIKYRGHIIELRDSLKLLPFSVKRIGQSFQTKHKKLDMVYEGFRYPGCDITEEEQKYIANDVLVVKEALEIMFSEGHNKLTIGSCCLDEYKNILGEHELIKTKQEIFNELFPNLYEMELDSNIYGSPTIGDYIHKSYKGGWCYLVKGKENRIYKDGITADVNSLYPSVMSSESNSYYPVGKPVFWSGNYIPDEATKPNRYYFIRIRTRFFIKKNKLPFIQVKGNLLYKPTEMLETSDIYDKKTDTYYTSYKDKDGNIIKAELELTLTMTDWILLNEHYNLVDLEILDGCIFYARKGIFADYIERYRKMKMESTGARRELAKLFLNNLYGKMASNTDSSFKVAVVKEDNTLGFIQVIQNNKIPGYIPVGSAITSYARNFTIRAAQKNFYGANKAGFIYADTDSIHCNLKPEKLKGIPVDKNKFCHWKLEASWDEAIFVRQKTYIEHVTGENLTPIDEPYYNVKCAGMPDKCKNNFLADMKTLKDFKVGLKVFGKLMPKRIRGGIVLVEGYYEMR